MRSRKYTAGVTLLEAMLVLAIMGALLAAGIRQYQQFKMGSDVEQLRYDINVISNAAALYYYANCGIGTDNALNPTELGPVIIDIKSQLIDTGYLTAVIPLNPLVDVKTAASYQGFKLQFKRYETPRYVCTKQVSATEPSTGPNTWQQCGEDEKKQLGTIIGWQIQVLFKPLNPLLLNNLKHMTEATCLTEETGETCTVTSPGTFLAYVRTPVSSMDVKAGQSTTWPTNPTLQEFKQMYETYPINYLLNVSHDAEYQYFYCGS